MLDWMHPSKALYRILPFDRAVQMFRDQALHFTHPSKWQDPYEKLVKGPAAEKCFAQCWCTRAVSDAMWRIYSPDHRGVRVKTTRVQFDEVLRAWRAQKADRRVCLQPVTYDKPVNLRSWAPLGGVFENFNDIPDECEVLLMKRVAFDFESEARAVVYEPTATEGQIDEGLKIPIEPHSFITSILMDPRGPDEIAEAFKHYFINVLGFKGDVRRSELYAVPRPDSADDPDETMS